MWDYDSLLGKAKLYFVRAREHPRDDDAFPIWLLLGLEFLLRSPLAQVHPTLLAEPNGESILHAAGIPRKPDGSEPKSIPTHTVISRLGRVIEAFTKERQDDATILIGLRNQELHTGAGALAIDSSRWLPRFTRVVELVCEHLGLDPVDLLGSEIVEQGRGLVDQEDQRLRHEIAKRIETAAAFFNQLQQHEIEARRQDIPLLLIRDPAGWPSTDWEVVPCPACAQPKIPIFLRAVRTTNERLEDGEIYRDVVYVARALSCPICGLELKSTAEIQCAGLQQQYTRQEHESLEERFLSDYEPDYGND